MKKENLKLLVAIAILLAFIGWDITSQEPMPTENVRSQYTCDYKVGIKTNIDIYDDNYLKYHIEGDLFRAYEDPLTMENTIGTNIAYAGDTYNFITQNDHSIYIGDEHLYDVVGEIKFFGDKYTIYNNDSEIVATVDFNINDTVGKMYDIDQRLIAQYNSRPIRKDYTVSVFSGCEFSDESLLMIFASYVSDKEADN